uniref:PA domain-containing protein n=1 Tax=Acanthochromis polyacanthus TaxID=80966 RepID=A0A3Q1F8X6_9TELE
MGEKMQHCLLLVDTNSPEQVASRRNHRTCRHHLYSIQLSLLHCLLFQTLTGVYGRDSPLDKAKGIVTLPKGDPVACNPYDFSNRNSSSPPWIALVKRGNCTFAEKINAAKRQGAVGVVVYNEDGNGKTYMKHG